MDISPVLWQFLVKWLNASALFPREASTIAPYTDALYFFLLSITVIGLVLVGTLIFGFSLRYRKEKHPVATRSKARRCSRRRGRSFRWRSSWSAFVWGALLYFRIYNPPTNSMNIYVVGKQWMWKAEHPGGQHEINALHVPTGRPVQLTMISQDVFHSFSIPDFRVKREVIPGPLLDGVVPGDDAGDVPHLLHAVLRHEPLGDDRRSHGADPGRLREVDGANRPAACRWRRTASGSSPAWAAMRATPATPRRADQIWPASTGPS